MHREMWYDHTCYGRSSPVARQTQITVKINSLHSMKKFLKGNWQWIVTTLIGSGILGWILEEVARGIEKKEVPEEALVSLFSETPTAATEIRISFSLA